MRSRFAAGSLKIAERVGRVADRVQAKPLPPRETGACSRNPRRFVARVEENAHAEALEEFHTADATMQENQGVPRVGRDAHVANERRVLARAKALTSKRIGPVFVRGDHVVIRWLFRFEWMDGTVTEMEDLAYPRSEGERIAEETFFYDPAQRVPKTVTA